MLNGTGEKRTRPIAGKKLYLKSKKEPVMGFEPATDHLRSDCSTTELHRLATGL